MNVLFYLGHPAHFHLFKHVFARLQERGHPLHIAIKSKEVLEDLLRKSGFAYHNIYPGERGKSVAAILYALLQKDRILMRHARRFRPDLMLGTSVEITHVGKLLGIPSAVVNEDDHDVVPQFAKLGYPLASQVIAPNCCTLGPWEHKRVGYEGYHELAYLGPRYFSPDPEVLRRYGLDEGHYALLRLSGLNAYHDKGVSGLQGETALALIEKLSRQGRLVISSEQPLEGALRPYGQQIRPEDMHSLLSYARLYIGDSQTMAAEAAVLGTPSIRFNDFVGRIGYLNELETKYGLTVGIKRAYPERLMATVDEMLAQPDLRATWQKRRAHMLAQTIDVTEMLTWFIESYPRSAELIRRNGGRYVPELMGHAVVAP